MSEKLYISITVVPLIIAIFILGFIFPKISRKEILFGVKIPSEIYEESNMNYILKSYYKNYLLICGIYSLVFIICILIKPTNVLINTGIFILIALIFGVYFRSHIKIKNLKNEVGHKDNKKKAVVIDTSFRQNKNKKMAPSILCFLIPVILIISNIIVGFSVYEHLPLFIPSFWNLNGDVCGALLKTYKVIFIFPIIETFITLFMLIIYKVICLCKQKLNIREPELSKERNRLFRYRWSLFILILNTLTVILYSINNFEILQVIHFGFRRLILLNALFTIIVFLSIIGMLLWTGQGGSRIKVNVKTENNDRYEDRDCDKYWKLGLIYYNSNDPALFVENRFGFGWGLNFGRIGAYIFVISIMILFFTMNYMVKILSMP